MDCYSTGLFLLLFFPRTFAPLGLSPSSLSFLVAVLLPAFFHNAATHGAEPMFVFSESRYLSSILQWYVASCFSYVCLYIKEAGEKKSLYSKHLILISPVFLKFPSVNL